MKACRTATTPPLHRERESSSLAPASVDSPRRAAVHELSYDHVVVALGVTTNMSLIPDRSVELLGELTAFVHAELRHYRRLRREEMRFHLFEAGDRLLPESKPFLAGYAGRVLRE